MDISLSTDHVNLTVSVSVFMILLIVRLIRR